MKARTLIAAALLALPCLVAAQEAPKAPVRIIGSLPTGSGPDVVARQVADRLQARWGQPVVVDARPGGAGVVAINAMKASRNGASELIVLDVGTLSINPLIYRKLAYDPERDFTPVALLYKTAFFVAVAADGPYRTLEDLMAAAKTKQLRYGSNAVGGPIHLASAQLEDALGTEMLHVPYKETSQLYASVAAGDVDWAYGSIATTAPLVRGGRLRLLAVADATRSPAMPDVPTLAEAGAPAGLDALTWVALLAPATASAGFVAETNRAVNEALVAPDAKERLAGYGFVAEPGPPGQVTELMRRDRARYARVLERVKVSVD